MRLSALLAAICGTSDAFTVTLSQRRSVASPLGVSKTSEAIPDLSSSTKPVDESNIFATSEGDVAEDSSWQKNLDMLLRPDTSSAERQIVLSDLLTSGEDIQESVRTALRERKVSLCSGYTNGFMPQANCISLT